MSGVEIDTSELRAFAADMSRLPGELSRHLIPTVKRGAVNVKNQMITDLQESGNAGFRYVGRTVSFDMIDTGGAEVGAEIGPAKPDGGLANIAYFGTYKGGGTVRDPLEALMEEAPRFEKALGDIVEDLWGA